MSGFTRLEAIGFAGRDAELRHLPSGKTVASFTLAATRRYTGADGEPQEEVTWLSCSAFDRLGEIAADYVKKGRQIYVSGRPAVRTYRDRNGEPRASLDLMVNDLTLLGRRPEADDDEEAAEPVGAAPAGGELPF